MQIGGLTIKPGQLYIGIAMLMALICGLIMKGGLSTKSPNNTLNGQQQATEKEPTTPVVVATYPVHAGDVIQPDQLKVVDWPLKLLPVGHTFADISTLVGKAVKADVFQGEPVFSEKMSTSEQGGLPVVIPKGLRAVTIAVSEVKGVAGFIKPGDKVDVLATFDLQENNKKDQLTKTVLQNILVVATAQSMVKNDLPKPEDIPPPAVATTSDGKAKNNLAADKPDANSSVASTTANDTASANSKKEDKATAEKKDEEKETAKLVASITLALTPTQAEKLTLAEDTGIIRLVLRGNDDAEDIKTSGIKQSQLIGKQTPIVSVKTPAKLPILSNSYAPRYAVEVIEGTQKRNQSF
jgi:Flp pilus assembly protein CpaB